MHHHDYAFENPQIDFEPERSAWDASLEIEDVLRRKKDLVKADRQLLTNALVALKRISGYVEEGVA